MKIPIIIGLPGVGKSTLSNLLAQKLQKKYISTDVLFREYRALPLESSQKEVEIMRNFLKRVKKEYAQVYEDIYFKAKKNMLKDSRIFRSLGENIFRLYEIEMIKYLYKNNKFKDTIVDLSASALLFKENRDLFSAQNGYKKILLDTNLDIILLRLEKDYQIFKEHLKNTEIRKPIRGNYEIAAENAEKKGENAIAGLKKQLLLDYKNRIEKYREIADEIIIINDNILPESICQKIINEII